MSHNSYILRLHGLQGARVKFPSNDAPPRVTVPVQCCDFLEVEGAPSKGPLYVHASWRVLWTNTEMTLRISGTRPFCVGILGNEILHMRTITSCLSGQVGNTVSHVLGNCSLAEILRGWKDYIFARAGEDMGQTGREYQELLEAFAEHITATRTGRAARILSL
ncbi:MAG: hypothetical protein M3O22_06415 [Pseudomonadota bacterium]|nr:hypothetical protein [Pseudomonadota bacterium]